MSSQILSTTHEHETSYIYTVSTVPFNYTWNCPAPSSGESSPTWTLPRLPPPHALRPGRPPTLPSPRSLLPPLHVPFHGRRDASSIQKDLSSHDCPRRSWPLLSQLEARCLESGGVRRPSLLLQELT